MKRIGSETLSSMIVRRLRFGELFSPPSPHITTLDCIRTKEKYGLFAISVGSFKIYKFHAHTHTWTHITLKISRIVI